MNNLLFEERESLNSYSLCLSSFQKRIIFARKSDLITHNEYTPHT